MTILRITIMLPAMVIVSLPVSLPIVLPWIHYSRDRLKLSHDGKTVFFILLASSTGGPIFAYLYANPYREPYVAFILGIVVMTFASLSATDLLRLDYAAARAEGIRFRLRLKTLLGLVAVVSFVLATLAPAFRW